MQSPTTNKDKIRKPLLALRAQLSKSEQQEKSAKIVEHIKQSNVFMQSKKIAFYHAVRGEADPKGLFNSISNSNDNQQFYLPLLSSDKNQGLVFAPIDQNTQYKNNAFSIPEPIVETHALLDAKELDLVIMPLLGFDLTGSRLGMGGGYYDRCFAFKQSQPKKPVLMGFAYDFQQLDEINAEPWDISLDMIATEGNLRVIEAHPPTFT
ncbi:MAG: 5-formyltetrahydrofolate cyclo-ligase [Cocleimonas sp.]|nr:5-formyltetrahydrofolate cyclo-ligase [Cocleimonas sp.]